MGTIGDKPNLPPHRSHFAAACLIVCMSAAPARAQVKTAEFEVASVKLLDQTVMPGRPDLSFVGTSGKIVKIAGNRITVNGTLRTLIAAAYGVKDYQVTAAPDWGESLIYAVVAKTAGDAEPTQEEIRPMLQSMLADRFQLKLRHETKELPVYPLTSSQEDRGVQAGRSG